MCQLFIKHIVNYHKLNEHFFDALEVNKNQPTNYTLALLLVEEEVLRACITVRQQVSSRLYKST